METTLGGDRLGSGNKQNIHLKNYERSTHDLSYVFKSSMAAGTLVPFMNKVALPGDKWEIKLNTDVMTFPTIGPLFGSYKVQLDVFYIPVRLYHSKLHNNMLYVGMKMSDIKLPQIELRAVNKIAAGYDPELPDNSQINASCLMKYLGISGLGTYNNATPNPLKRYFNAVPVLAYWDIYKNYYANKQEQIGAYIHTSGQIENDATTPISAALFDKTNVFKGYCLGEAELTLSEGDKLYIYYPTNAVQPIAEDIPITLAAVDKVLSEAFTGFQWDSQNKIQSANVATSTGLFTVKQVPSPTGTQKNAIFGIKTFPLSYIDDMRSAILKNDTTTGIVIGAGSLIPYSSPMETVNGADYAATYSQECLGLKTYQSDLFNNWITTEWIEGANGISTLTAVDTTGGSFTIDAFNIASKVYDMLNRIAVSGGSYDDWLNAVYTHERVRGVESPTYCGSLIKELAFEEIVSTAQSTDPDNTKIPLGTLAGRGRLTGKHKGGYIEITVNEPSYIMGIVSITPRLDYSQGNEWDVNLKTMDDFHKPALDGIGFQDLISEQLVWSDTILTGDNLYTQQTLGKQPAWINYMTAVNKSYGSFAEQTNCMFMTLNRRYEKTNRDGYHGRIKDATTYIDPTKFNNIFAETALSSQNFWVQIACDITARRKMSAKIIPNL
ncbi:MAG: major capsid protein [Microviridae sp.]|nr:MAG: major capsid protein [Microviridae sp.]